VMIALNLQTSFLTPPFGFALFYLRGVVPESVPTSTIYRGVIPFIVMQLLTMGIVALLPSLATWLPDIVYNSVQ
jgi:TRAP-type mannitol/chloroaromatic compound transport system permease large subunit